MKFILTEPGRESDTSCPRWKIQNGDFLAWTWSSVYVETIQKKISKSLRAQRVKKYMQTSFNRAWERNWYIMSPMKNPKRWFFALNMKFSMCRDYTKKNSKIAPCAKGEKKYANIQVIRTIILKISNSEANLEIFKIIVRITCIFAYFFSPFAHGAILEKKKFV